MLNQEKIKEEMVYLDNELKDYFNENYFKKNKNIYFNIDYYNIFLCTFKNKELKKQIYEDVVGNLKDEIEKNKKIFGYNNIKENYSKEELRNKKKLLIKELKKAKNKLKNNKIHKEIFSKFKSNQEDEIFYFIKQLMKSNNLYYDKEKTITKYFKYLEEKFKFNIKYNVSDLSNDSFEIILNSNKKININFKTKERVEEAEGYYSPSENKVAVITPKIYRKEKYMDLEDIFTFAHEFGHAVEDLFKDLIIDIDKLERSEVVSLYFENLISEEFIYELTKDKEMIEIIKYKRILHDFSLIYTCLRMLKSKKQENINIKDKEVKIYKGYLRLDILYYSLFHLNHDYVPFDQYFLGNYYSKIMKSQLLQQN